MSINKNIDRLIKEDFIIIPFGLIFVILVWFVKYVYKVISNFNVSEENLYLYNHQKENLIKFLDFIDNHSSEFKKIKVNLKSVPNCNSFGSNKELKCIVNYLIFFEIAKIDILTSTLYDDGYDLLKIRSIHDFKNIKYPKTKTLNSLLQIYNDNLIDFKNTIDNINNISIKNFGKPLSSSYKDIESSLNNELKHIVVDSIDWKH